jgi:ABC-2 type transport system permease protein
MNCAPKPVIAAERLKMSFSALSRNRRRNIGMRLYSTRPRRSNLAPGSWAWLLAHEIRIKWRGLAARWSSATVMNVAIGAFVLLHVFAWWMLRYFKPDFTHLPPLVFIGAACLILLVFTLMISSAIDQAVRVLFTRGDLDLLLASPLPMRKILTVRALGIAANSVLLLAVVVLPFANVAAMLGSPRLLALYPLLIAMALWAASLGLAATFALVRLLGPRRARTVAQILSAIIGAVFVLLSQAQNVLSEDQRKALAANISAWLKAHESSLLWTPAHAALGDPLPLAILFLSEAGAFAVMVMATRRAVVAGAGANANKRRRRRQHVAWTVFHRGVGTALLVKEWRLIRRDPFLISQVLLKMLYLVPMFVVVFKGAASQPHEAHAVLHLAGPALVFLAASLAGSLSWITISAEDAPALLMVSPIGSGAFKLFKILAALIPVWLLMAPVVAYLVWQDPRGGVAVTLVLAGATVSTAWLSVCAPTPGSRHNFRRRRPPDVITAGLQMVTLLGWAALGYALPVLAWWSFITLPFCVVGPLIAWRRGARSRVRLAY